MRNHDSDNKSQQKKLMNRLPMAGRGGFTLIELLVSIAIASVLMFGMVEMFRSNRMALALVDDIRNMEQNARVGMDFLSRDFRRAGMGAQQDFPFIPIDNADATDWGVANSGFTAKGHPVLPGTDIAEMFWGYLPVPVCVNVNVPGPTGFSTNNANMKLPRVSLMGLPDYSLSLTTQEVGDLLDPYTVLVYDPTCPSDVNCQQNLTDGGWNSAGGTISVQLGYNRGMNQDDANRPHTCNEFDDGGAGGCVPSGTACINIGEDIYYFVQKVEANNPQLVRYKTGRTVTYNYEVMSNYVEDFQIMYGVDGLPTKTSVDGLVDSSEWLNGLQIENAAYTNAISRVRMVRVYILVKSKKQDQRLAAGGARQNPPSIENSTIAMPAGGGDFYRRRLLSRTVRLRSHS